MSRPSRRGWPNPEPATLQVSPRGQDRTLVEVQVHHAKAEHVAVFCNGLGLPLDYWLPVVNELPGVACVLYDRPGLGRSGPWQAPPGQLAVEVDLLSDIVIRVAAWRGHRRLTRAVLVGHSYGAIIAEAAARTMEPVGLVLVDPTDPRQEAAGGPGPSPRVRRTIRALAARPSVARPAGMLVESVVLAHSTVGRQQRGAPTRRTGAFRRPRHLSATLEESQRVCEHSRQLLQLAQTAPLADDLPVRVLVGARDGWTGRRRQDGWVAQARRRSLELGRGTKVTVFEAGHLLMLDVPPEVAHAISSVLS